MAKQTDKTVTHFYPKKSTRPFFRKLLKILKGRKINFNEFINAVVPAIAAEMEKGTQLKGKLVELDLGVIDINQW